MAMRSGRGVPHDRLVKNDICDQSSLRDSTAWARAVAVAYDPFLRAGEQAGVRELRRELLGKARGRLELNSRTLPRQLGSQPQERCGPRFGARTPFRNYHFPMGHAPLRHGNATCRATA